MISKSSLEHIRLPFSFFLLPIFLLALITVNNPNILKSIAVFFILHFLLYTASNGFNSYYDRDEESIGGLKNPPKVTEDLLPFSLFLDGCAVAAAFFVSPIFAAGCFIYGLASKAYSYDKIRLKRFPIMGWLCTGIGQGVLTFLLIIVSVQESSLNEMLKFNTVILALLTGFFLLGFYPLTQVYQHKEDNRRGDKTISILLGIRGTFLLSAIFLTAAITGLVYYFYRYFGAGETLIFTLFMAPAAWYFLQWMIKIWKDESFANFSHSFRMSLIASTGLNLFCLGLIVWKNWKIH